MPVPVAATWIRRSIEIGPGEFLGNLDDASAVHAEVRCVDDPRVVDVSEWNAKIVLVLLIHGPSAENGVFVEQENTPCTGVQVPST